jgi:RNA polymerase subunit RPABC4/transcription elongation factor Spt4
MTQKKNQAIIEPFERTGSIMKEKTCPTCKTKVFNDPQHCPACQNGLRAPRLNLVGRIVMIAVPVSILALLAAIVYFIWQFVELPDKNAHEFFYLCAELCVSCAVWRAVLWVIAQFEFLVTTR